MDWVYEALRRRRQQMMALEASMPTFEYTAATGPDEARGWLFLNEFYTCVQDVRYPWDPAVMRAIREFCPDAMPILIKSIWRRSRLSHMHPEEMILVRHGIARAIRDPIAPVHTFYCDMPARPIPGIPLRRPNYIEVNWYDKLDRPWGHDLPGAYLPFDWELHASLRQGYEDNLSSGDLIRKLCDPYFARRKAKEMQAHSERAYEADHLLAEEKKILDQTSELEMRDAFLGDQTPPKPNPTVAVSASPSSFKEGA